MPPDLVIRRQTLYNNLQLMLDGTLSKHQFLVDFTPKLVPYALQLILVGIVLCVLMQACAHYKVQMEFACLQQKNDMLERAAEDTHHLRSSTRPRNM